MGGSPGLVVMAGDSCSKGRVFETWCRLLYGHFFTYVYVSKIEICLKR